MNRQIRELEPVLDRLIEDLGYRLWALQFAGQGGNKTLRIYIDQPDYSGSINLDDCERVSREVAALLDVEDPIHGSYNLEISSPGVDRPLFRPEHFRLCTGRQIVVRTYAKMAGRHKLTGLLQAADDQSIEMLLDDGTLLEVAMSGIRTACLAPDYQAMMSRSGR